MTEHWKAALWLGLLSVLGVILGLAYSPVVGVVAIAWAIVGWFVVGTAWMRPRGYEEHDDRPRMKSAARAARSSDRHTPKPKPPTKTNAVL